MNKASEFQKCQSDLLIDNTIAPKLENLCCNCMKWLKIKCAGVEAHIELTNRLNYHQFFGICLGYSEARSPRSDGKHILLCYKPSKRDRMKSSANVEQNS